MATHPDYPRISSKLDRHDKTRWRFMDGKRPLLPGEPHTPEFDAAYQALCEGREIPRQASAKPPRAEIVRLPVGNAVPTFKQAWLMIQASVDWKSLDDKTKEYHGYVIRSFLDLPVIEDEDLLWGDVPVSDMTADDLETVRDRLSSTPSRPRRVKILLAKIFKLARRKGWRLDNPIEFVEFKRGAGRNGNYVGHKPWPAEIRAKFEARHPIGTPARTCYALGMWFGNRREDVALLTWDQLREIEVEGEVFEAFVFEQSKEVQSDEDMTQYRPYSAMMREVLEPIRKATGPVLVSPKTGKAYEVEALSEMMRYWNKQAGIPKGYRLHGLRKSYAVQLAESGATPRQQMDMLGHTTMQQAAYYSRGADKQKTTLAATKLMEEKWRRQNPPKLAVVK